MAFDTYLKNAIPSPVSIRIPVLMFSLFSHVRLCDPMDCSPPGFSVHGDSPGKKTAMGWHVFLQGISPNQGSNRRLLRLLHCRQILDHLAICEAPLLGYLLIICFLNISFLLLSLFILQVSCSLFVLAPIFYVRVIT